MLATGNEAEILKRVIRPDIGDLSPEAARGLLRLGFPESDHARMAELSEKASAGTLTPIEHQELEGYINIGYFLDFVHSKARMALRTKSTSNV